MFVIFMKMKTMKVSTLKYRSLYYPKSITRQKKREKGGEWILHKKMLMLESWEYDSSKANIWTCGSSRCSTIRSVNCCLDSGTKGTNILPIHIQPRRRRQPRLLHVSALGVTEPLSATPLFSRGTTEPARSWDAVCGAVVETPSHDASGWMR